MTDVGRPYEPRALRFRVGRSGDIKPVTLSGRQHFAVPIVALVEGVVWPANVDKPEFVPAEVLAELPIGWNGKPITQSHPQDGTDYVSANYPDIYEKYAYGLIFNSRFEDGKLLMEAWVDPSRIRPGSVAERSWEALQRGEMVEVSVGAFITKIEREGEYRGQRYYAIWQDIVPDHLAILAEGEIGACSIEMGCGALRVAKRHTITEQGIEVSEGEMAAPSVSAVFCTKHPTQEVKQDSACPACLAASKLPAPSVQKSWSQRFKDALTSFVGLAAEDVTLNDLMEKLERVLRATEPGHLGVVTVKPEAHEVVYAVYPEDRVIYYQRTYSVADSGEVSLGDERVEVQRVEKYEQVSASSAPPAPQGGCGCHNKPSAAAQTASTGEAEMNKDVLIHALVGSGKFTDAQRPYLATLSEDALTSLMATPTAPSAPAPSTPAPAPTPSTPSAPSSPAPTPSTPSSMGALAGASEQTMEQFIAAAPAHLQPSLRAAHQRQQEVRAQTIAALKATGRCTFTDAQLATKTDQELAQLASLASAPVAADFSGRGLPQSTTGGDEVPEPPSLVTAIRNARGIKSA